MKRPKGGKSSAYAQNSLHTNTKCIHSRKSDFATSALADSEPPDATPYSVYCKVLG
jgi:hypothetical protein